MSNFKSDFSKATLFYQKNYDKIKNFVDGELFNIELDSKRLSTIFDQYGSTDAILKTSNNLIYAVALRVNFKEQMHKTITIRYSRHTGSETEFYKSIRAFKNNSLNASIGIQLDADGDDLISGVVYDRKALFFNVLDNIKAIKIYKVFEPNKQDFNEMIALKYSYLEENNIKHKIIKF
jgi:hypothetical protein